VPTPGEIGPNFQLGKEALAATKNIALGVAVVWGIFLPIAFIWNPDSNVFWVCFVLFGILGPVGMTISSTFALIRKRRYFVEGVDTSRYIPMFVHRAGLQLLSEKDTDYILALASMEELIFCCCEGSLCKQRKKDFFEDIKKEVARIPIRDVEDVFVISPEINESERMSTQVSEFLVNYALGALLHRSQKTMFFDAFIVVVLAGQSKQYLIFGIPNKISGAPIFDTLLKFLPEEVTNPIEMIGTAAEGVEALTVEKDDPMAIKNAKRVAFEVLAAKETSRVRARSQGLT
jgi:hypothetical protein